MLEKLTKLADNLKSIDIEKIIDEILNDLMPQILDLNLDQLHKGELNDHDLLNRYRSASYYEFKKSIGSYSAPNGAADLFVEGDFYRGFKGKVTESSIIIDSADSKALQLEVKYSSDIYGLNEENLQFIRDEIVPRLRERLTDKIKT